MQTLQAGHLCITASWLGPKGDRLIQVSPYQFGIEERKIFDMVMDQRATSVKPTPTPDGTETYKSQLY